MKCEKPQVIDLSRAVTAIHSGQHEVPCNCVESKQVLDLVTFQAFEADDQSIERQSCLCLLIGDRLLWIPDCLVMDDPHAFYACDLKLHGNSTVPE